MKQLRWRGRPHKHLWIPFVKDLDTAYALDKKLEAFAYIAVIEAARLESGIRFHVQHAKQLCATRDEIISSIFVGLPAVGNALISSLPTALNAYDQSPTNEL